MSLLAQTPLSPPPSYRTIAVHPDQTALVDDRDYDLVAAHQWVAFWIKGTCYATTKISGRLVYMHRLILGARRGEEVDHRRTGETLDNRRNNLRFAERWQNQANRFLQRNNTSGFRGVCLFKRTGRYIIYINARGKRVHLGYADTKEQGRDIRNAAAIRLHGEFARLD